MTRLITRFLSAALVAAGVQAFFLTAPVHAQSTVPPLKRDSVIEVVYVSALNCSFCRGWELSNLSDGRGFRATPDWREVSFTRLRKGAAGAMLSPSFFPERLRPVAEQIAGDARQRALLSATPSFIVLVDGHLATAALGSAAWDEHVYPALHQLVEQRATATQ
jgi:hypothetical protein